MKKSLAFFAGVCLLTAGCGSGGSPVKLSEEPISFVSNPAAAESDALIPASTSAVPDPIPEWVGGFANPLLAAVSNENPVFQDDFSRYRGWLNEMSGVDGRLYADLQDDMLLLELPERTKESFAYNPKISVKNFVLTLDLRFYHGQPKDTVRFQFDHASGQQISFEFSNNRSWKFHWGTADDLHSISGIYEHFPPEHIPVTIIMDGTNCAVYLNDEPLAYSDECREGPTPSSKAWTTTLRLLRGSARAVIVNFDNLKLWDLDAVSH